MKSEFIGAAFVAMFLCPQLFVHATSLGNPFAAVKSNNVMALTSMIDQGVDVNTRNESGQTLLMVAAMQHAREKLIEALIYQGADIRARDKNGMNALMHAAAMGELENAEQLLQIGIDPDIKDNTGKTVTDHAKAGRLNDSVGNKPSFVSMLLGMNGEKGPPHSFYLPYKPGTISDAEFRRTVVHLLMRKGWHITEVDGNVVRVFYTRLKQGRLYKAEVILEPTRMVVRFLPGFGFYADRGYLEGMWLGLKHEFGLY